MYTVLVILILVVCILLGVIVLVQNSKGGGLVSNFGGANQMMGVRQTTDFLEKTTWILAAILVVLCLVTSKIGGFDGVVKNTDDQSTDVRDEMFKQPSTDGNTIPFGETDQD